MSEQLGALLLIIGAAFMLIAAIGVVRMPDLLMRMQVTSKAVTLGAGCLLLAAAVFFDAFWITFRAVLAIVFFALTVPVATHLLGRASHRSGTPLWEETIVNELRDKTPF